MSEVIFKEMSSYSNGFIIDRFLANFEIFQNTQKETFFLDLCLRKSEILDYRAVALEKERQFTFFFGIFEILEHPFLSEQFQNVSVVQSSSRL